MDIPASIQPVKFFYSYAPQDRSFRDQLSYHLSNLKRTGWINEWDRSYIGGGANREETVNQHLDSANIILLLVDANLLASDDSYEEMMRALERHTRGEAYVVPILLRPVDWRGMPFSKLSVLPTNGVPVTQWSNEDEAFEDIARGLSELVKTILPRKLAGIVKEEGISYVSPLSSKITAAQLLQAKFHDNQFDVFLCHNIKDKPAVKTIGEYLKTKGILPWLDEWELRPGFPWQRLLEQHIEHIKGAAVFVGKDGIGPWQQLEIEAFLREFVYRGCPVIPVLLEDAPTEPKLPIFLRGYTWVDFRKPEPDPRKQLIWGITGEREYRW